MRREPLWASSREGACAAAGRRPGGSHWVSKHSAWPHSAPASCRRRPRRSRPRRALREVRGASVARRRSYDWAAMSLSPAVAGYDQLILDLDGCVWVGPDPVPGAVDAIEALRAAGKRVAFVTNDSRHALEDHVRKLWSIGVQASLADVVSAGAALQHLLAETRRGRTTFVIGADSLRRHVTDAGCKVLNGTDLASRAELVVVGHDEQLTYD